jgi:hypothetical protein
MIIRHKRTTTQSDEINPKIMYLEYDTETGLACHKDANEKVLKSWRYEGTTVEDFQRFPQRWPDYWYEVPLDPDLIMDIGL